MSQAATEHLVAPLSPSLTTSSSSGIVGELTPRSLSKRPAPMVFKDFGGVDPFPSVGTPVVEAAKISPMTVTLEIANQVSAVAVEKDPLSESKVLRPQLTIELDKSTSGVDPMPSLEARRAPGADPIPWEDELFDPTSEGGDYLDFDEEDSVRANNQHRSPKASPPVETITP